MLEFMGRIGVDADFWDGSARLLEAAEECAGDAPQMLGALRELPPVPVPGRGRTRSLLHLLSSIAAIDLTAARVVEPHFDAAAILAQTGAEVGRGEAWGVFASASPVAVRWLPGADSHSVAEGADAELTGTKRWCSLAAKLDRALVTASDSMGEWMFVVDLRQAAVVPRGGGAPLTGLRGVPSGPVDLHSATARAVGDVADWYTSRPGFAWGGIAVAAVWFGGAVALGRALERAVGGREPDQLGLAWLGEADRLLHGVQVQLDDAADRIDAGSADWALAQRVRGNTASACWRLLALCGEAMGPGPLAFDATHARRVADLTMYLSQHHGARDDAAHGQQLAAALHRSSEAPSISGDDS
ncbi:acyl-CoA dehydrogenase family protein [Pseudoclavibacter sp. AY1H1]|uniref:acyl-CoA dehydrogenase family protein n=1 Tax=Pseudoclavibacter sp. AY1H1 TaxID=2080584 RepID=UPI0011B0731C|nr:acyl-CoA dehydrogenase family protein [Pseudoclavibacter sp. AY1H1]